MLLDYIIIWGKVYVLFIFVFLAPNKIPRTWKLLVIYWIKEWID